MTKKEHIGSSIFVLLASGGGLVFSLIKHAQPKNVTALALDPYTLPSVVFAAMFILGICRLVIGLRMKDTGEKSMLLRVPLKSLLTAVFIGIYVLLLEKIGFVITSFAFLWAQMFILQDGKKNWKMMALISVVFSLGVYLLFSKVFSVMLPRGILTML